MIRAQSWVAVPTALVLAVLGQRTAAPSSATAAEAAPTVTGLTPPAGHLEGGDTVTIVGHGLGTARRVHFGSAVSTRLSHITSTHLKVVTPVHAAGTVSVQVDTVHGRSPRISVARFTYTAAPTFNWSAPTEPDPRSLVEGYGRISCATAQLCVTVGWPGFATRTQLLMLHGADWQWVTLPPSSVGQEARVDRALCPSTTLCLVSGWSGAQGDFRPTAWTWNGSSWAVSLVEDQSQSQGEINSSSQDEEPSGGSIDDSWQGLVCAPNDRYCIANDPAYHALIYDNGTWSTPAQQIYPLSCSTRTFCLVSTGNGYAIWNGAGARPIDNPFGSTFTWLASCPTATFCMAIAITDTIRYAIFDGNAWSTPRASNIAGALSCTAPDSCWSVGRLLTVRGDWASHYDGTTWSPAERIGDSGGIRGLSCWHSNECLASTALANLVTLDAGKWMQATPYPRTGLPADVSCASATMCIAVDWTGNALRYNGSRWQPPVPIDPTTQLVSVSCPTTHVCMAADIRGRVVQFARGHWHPARRVLPFPGVNFDVHVSCGSADFCVMWSSDGDAAVYDGAWHRKRQLAGPDLLKAVSCTPDNFCAAVAGKVVRDPAGHGTVIQGRVATYDGGRWHRPKHVGGKYTRLNDVSCTSRHFCSATGENVVVTYDGSWHRRTFNGFNSGVSCVQTFCAIVDNVHRLGMLNHGALGTAITWPRGTQVTTRPMCISRHLCFYGEMALDGAAWSDVHFPKPTNPPYDGVTFGDCTRHFCMMFTFLGKESHTQV